MLAVAEERVIRTEKKRVEALSRHKQVLEASYKRQCREANHLSVVQDKKRKRGEDEDEEEEIAPSSSGGASSSSCLTDCQKEFARIMQSKNLFAKYEIVDRDVFRDAKMGKMKIKLKRLSNEVEFFVEFESINASNIVERLRKASNMTKVRAA